MNKISTWFYKFRSIRLSWFRLKRRLNNSLNNREKIQESLDINAYARLPRGTFTIDHTIYFDKPNSMIVGEEE